MSANISNEAQFINMSESQITKDCGVVPISVHLAGIVYIEARIQDNIELENLELVCSSLGQRAEATSNNSQVQDVLEKELSKKDQVYDIGQDLLADSYSRDAQFTKSYETDV